MRLIVANDYNEMSKLASHYLSTAIKNHLHFVLGLATGGTPKGTYASLVNDIRQQKLSLSHVSTFNLDEYVGIPRDHTQSYHNYMKHNLFQHVDLTPEKIHIPDGMSLDLDKEAQTYEKQMKMSGGIDLQLLGIGQNGHIGFNEPGTTFNSKTHIVTLSDSTKLANSRYFPSLEEVPNQAISMGIKSILNSKEILLIASGAAKASALQQLFSKKVSEDFPASCLHLHKRVTVIADLAAAKLLDLSQLEVQQLHD
jgi:glucosamine-6-phosphate deaminase